jgi:3D (Asp-Asp-Asp) domain-containing protein
MRAFYMLPLLLLMGACAHRPHFALPRRAPDRWRLGQPVIASGPNKGKPKAVGITASGTRAQRGTVAADTRLYPFGTIVRVPGYGWGRVEDRGGDIKGQKLDLFFDSHGEALEWGRQRLPVEVWLPK